MKRQKRFKKSITQLTSRLSKFSLALLMTVSCMSSSLMMVAQTAHAATMYPEAQLTIKKGLQIDFSSAGLNKTGYVYNMNLGGEAAFCMDLGKHAKSGDYFARIQSKKNTVYNSIYNYFLYDKTVANYLNSTPGVWGDNNRAAAQGAIWAYEEGLNANFDDNMVGFSPSGAILFEVIKRCGTGGLVIPAWVYSKWAHESRNYDHSGTLYIYSNGNSSHQRLITTKSGDNIFLDEDFLTASASESYSLKNQVSVHKKDDGTNQSLEGVVFDFYQNGQKVGSSTTNVNGIASFETNNTVSATEKSSRFPYVVTNAHSKPNLDQLSGDTKAKAQAKANADAKKKAKAAAQAKAEATTQNFYAIERQTKDKYWLNPNKT